ncbi:cadherin-13 isoform X2 [Spea bombifrons]|uniref:cadherin-13 isoform X2 n=1 Tax=Spea bombifrons TaxID=233779 RepID=UPI00234B0BE2|nr:cadherin-13 isoform X2 [Spea bombifrons]
MRKPPAPCKPANMDQQPQLALLLLLSQVLVFTIANDIECIPGFQQKIFYVEQPPEFTQDQLVLNVLFDDCQGNKEVAYEVSSPDFKVQPDGSLIALRNVTEAVRALFIHARSAHSDDMAEVKILGRKDRHNSLKNMLKVPRHLPFLRHRRSIVAPSMSIPEGQRTPFPKIVGRVVVSELLPGSKFRMSGKGADQEPKATFRINENTGEVQVTRTLDREEIPFYHLQVEVNDENGKTVEGPVDLEIVVIDQNDNRPIFREGPYVGHVLEGSPTGTTVMHMVAFDADDPTTDNAVLRYNILKQIPDKPSPNMFYIDPEKGDIVTVVSPQLLDRETLPAAQYELTIEAKDMAGSDVGLPGTATATIVIDDKNDHPPEFTRKEFQATVKEGVAGVMINLTVEDQDDPSTGAWRAVYTIINGNPGQSFEIHTNTKTNEGMLSVVKPLDYEISAFHTLLIKVENEDPLIPDVAYGPSSTATVQVNVLDVNEGPVFHPDPMSVTKVENITVGSVLFTVNATDPDKLQHQSIRYSILKDEAGWLYINPLNGTINTTAPLDRESIFVHNNTYTALIQAIDDGTPPATGTGTFQITLEDINDNAPYIHPTLAKVCEDAKDLNVVVLGASDRDLHHNSESFKFELGKQTGPDKAWKITALNNTHAQVSLVHHLKRANYNLPVMVTDAGKPPLTNTTELKIQVCSCKKGKMDCSSAAAPHISLVLVLILSLSSLFCL